MELCGALGVELCKAREHRVPAELVILRAKLIAQGVVGCVIGKVEPGDKRVYIQPRAADKNGQLAAREDAGTVLVNLYKAYKLNDQSQLDRYACLRLDYLETMLAQPEILAKLTDEQCRELAAECYNKATQIMNARNDEYGITQALYLGMKSLMRADSEFARIVNGSDGARTFAETGVLVPRKISNADLGAMAARVRLVIG